MFPLKDNIPTRRFPVITVALIAINAIAYLFLQHKSGIDFSGNSLDQRDLYDYAAVPCRVDGQCGVSAQTPGTTSPVVTVFTAMFSHAGLLHLGGNMLFLWIFGNNVEDSMGRLKFVAFYLLGGLAALGLQIVIDPSSTVPTLGASGAIAGVLGGYLLLYPRARVVVGFLIIFFFAIREIPAWLVLGFWFLQQAFFAAIDVTNGAQGEAAASRTSRTSAASCSACSRSSCSPPTARTSPTGRAWHRPDPAALLRGCGQC